MNEQDVLIYFTGAAIAGVSQNTAMHPDTAAKRAVDIAEKATQELMTRIAHRLKQNQTRESPLAQAAPSIATTGPLNGA